MNDYEVEDGVSAYILIIFLFATIIQFGMGKPFYSGAYKACKHGSANMDVLVVLGTTSAYVYGVLLIVLRLCKTGDGVDMESLNEEERIEMIH